VNQRGDIVLGWLIKLIVSLALVGLVAFEAGAVVVARVGVDSAANEAAGEAALEYSHSHDEQAAEAAASEQAETSGAIVVAFEVDAAHNVVILTLEKKARTVFLHRIGATKSWSVARATARRGIPD